MYMYILYGSTARSVLISNLSTRTLLQDNAMTLRHGREYRQIVVVEFWGLCRLRLSPPTPLLELGWCGRPMPSKTGPLSPLPPYGVWLEASVHRQIDLKTVHSLGYYFETVLRIILVTQILVKLLVRKSSYFVRQKNCEIGPRTSYES